MTRISALSIGLVYLTIWISNCQYYGSNAFTLYLMPEPTEKSINYRQEEDWPDIPQKTLSDVWIGYNAIPEKTLSNVWVGYNSQPESVLDRLSQQLINNRKESSSLSSNNDYKIPENWPQNNKLPESWPDYAENRLAQILTFSKRGKFSPAWAQLKQKRISQAWYEEQTLWPDYLEKRLSNRLDAPTNGNSRLAKSLLENSQINRLSEPGFKQKRYGFESSEDMPVMYRNYLQHFWPGSQASATRRGTNIVIEDKNAVCTRFDCSKKTCCSGVCANVFGSNLCLNYG